MSDAPFVRSGQSAHLGGFPAAQPRTGGLTRGRAATAGAVTTGWLGLLTGLFVGIFVATGTDVFALGFYGLLGGAGIGALLGLVAQVATRGPVRARGI